MIRINDNLALRSIKSEDYKKLHSLMKEVYPPAYSHFWKDSGDWYIEDQYSKDNIQKELSEEKASYYFIMYNGEKVGNFRILWDEQLPNLEKERKSVKLHRVYIHPKFQGKGIGKKLLYWLEEEAVKREYELIWLDAMDEKTQAFEFYRRMGYKYHSHCYLSYTLLYHDFRKMSQVYKELV